MLLHSKSQRGHNDATSPWNRQDTSTLLNSCAKQLYQQGNVSVTSDHCVGAVHLFPIMLFVSGVQ